MKAIYLSVIAVLLTGRVASYLMTPDELSAFAQQGIILEEIIPTEFGRWREDERFSIIVPTEESELSQKIYDQTLTKGYINPKGQTIMLLIAYGASQSDTLRLHSPEVCYVANGFTLREVSDVDLPLIDLDVPSIAARRMSTINANRYEPVTYWTRVGDSISRGNAQSHLIRLKYGLTGVIPDGVLIRVSNISTNLQQSYDLHAQFIEELLSAVPEEHQKFLLGTPKIREVNT